MIRLDGKTAIVTGAANGIGLAIADLYREAGARVIGVDLEPGPDIIQADVSSEADVKRIASGPIDIVCNNAAYFAKGQAAADATEDQWERCFRVTIMGAQFFTAAVLPGMIERGGGCILNIASVQGIVGARNSVAYTSMKHALIGFTRSVAYDYGPKNIRCNAICPGAITTRISPPPGSELYERQIGKTFLGRVGKPQEVAYAALFLSSDAASYITGAVLPVDGGWTAM